MNYFIFGTHVAGNARGFAAGDRVIELGPAPILFGTIQVCPKD